MIEITCAAENPIIAALGLLFLLYAETHYSFRGIYSRLKKKEPEVIADAPHRIEPGRDIPVLLLIKDADRHPIQLQRATVIQHLPGGTETTTFELNTEGITSPFWSKILSVPVPEHRGNLRLDVRIHCRINGKQRIIRNDNYIGTSHAPFDIQISQCALPKTANWHFGEFHCHTSYTSDQVEFGAPLHATRELAQAMGLSFYCTTDHSYDLDDEPQNYLKSDPQLTKWMQLLQEVEQLNRWVGEFVIVPGEEVSVGNSEGQNVHFLLLNHPTFFPGGGDSAERWLRTRPEFSITQLLDQVNSSCLAFAAHPAVKPPLLQRLLVRRGKWQMQDCRHQRLDGLQVWNGTQEGLEEGKKMWVDLLLQGRRLFITGGNDAHGNFNRFRQIGLPFITMRENHDHLFGKVRTGVHVEGQLTLASLLAAVKAGRMVVTDGPFVEMKLRNDGGEAMIGGALSGAPTALELHCLSSPEFGELESVRIYIGDLARREEHPFCTAQSFQAKHQHRATIELSRFPKAGYVRVELYSRLGNRQFKCLTNPIWVKQRCESANSASKML